MNEDIRKYIGEQALGCCFSDLSGRDFWKSILGSYWFTRENDESLALPMVQCLVLHGPFGSGKTSLIQAMAGEMIEGGYTYLELDLKWIPKKSVCSVFELLKTEYIKNGPIFIFINHLDEFGEAAVMWDFYEWAGLREEPMIIAGIAKDDENLDSDIRKLFHSYYIDLPDRLDREAFFKENLEQLFDRSSIQGMTKLLDGTEGYDYMQMESLIQKIKMRIKFEILKHGKALDVAMSWLSPEFIEEVLIKSKPHKASNVETNDLTALIQAMAAIKTSSDEQVKEKTKEIDPLSDFQSKFSPKKIFDQGLMFVKDK